MNNNLKPITTLPPFKRLCMTIGELPTSYLETMTYYEMLVWFTEYMRNTIIPIINNNGLAVKELQDKYIELKTYIDNYFDNLDVQEEINNKLDEMVEDGTLQSIIASFLNSNALWTYNSVDDMKSATNLIDDSFCKTLGFYELNDNGNGLYKVREKTQNDVVDNALLIQLNDETLVAELLFNDYLNVKSIGVKGDNETDDTILIQKAFDTNATTIYFPEGTYLVKVDTQDCELTDTTDNSKCAILINNSKKIIKGNNATLKLIHNTQSSGYDLYAISSNYPIEIYNIIFDGQYSSLSYTYGIQLNNSNNIIENCKFYNMGGSGLVFNGSSLNNINYNNVNNCEFKNCGNSIFCAWVNDTNFENLKFTNVSEGIDFDKLSTNVNINNIIANGYRGTGADALIEINGCKNFSISNVNCKNFIDGILINGKIINTENLDLTTSSENITINNCNFDTITGYGILFGNAVADIQEELNILISNVNCIKCSLAGYHLRGDNIKISNCSAELCNYQAILIDKKAGNISIDNFTNKKCKRGFISATIGDVLTLSNIYDDEDGNTSNMNSINGVTNLTIDGLFVVNTSNFSTNNNRLYYINTTKATLNRIQLPILANAILFVTSSTLYTISNSNTKLNVIELGNVNIIKSNLTPTELGSQMTIQTGTIFIYEGGLNNANIYICTSGNYGGGVLHWQSITGTSL